MFDGKTNDELPNCNNFHSRHLILLLSKGAIALQQTIHIKNCGDSAFVNFSAECDSDKLRQMIDMITYLSEELSRFDVSMQHHPEILYYVITSWQVFKPRRVERFSITLSIACICRPIKFNWIKLKIVWSKNETLQFENVFLMASRLVETVQAKMADYFSFFSRPNVTRMQIFHSTFNNRTDFRMQNFELACTFSDCETAILYPKDFNLTKLLNAILSFDFITLLKSFWFPQALLTFRLSSDVCLLKRS